MENRDKVLKKMLKILEFFLKVTISALQVDFFFVLVKSYSILPVRL